MWFTELSRYCLAPIIALGSLTPRQRNLAIVLLIALIAYIVVTYYNWQQRQIYEHELGQVIADLITKRLHDYNHDDVNDDTIEGFKSSNNNDGIRGIVASATPIYINLDRKQVIQPNSDEALALQSRISKEYLSLMDSRNIAARGKDTLDELQQFMNECCVHVTDDEFNHVISYFKPRITNPYSASVFQSYIDYWVPKIYLAKSRDGLEYNMPHTHATTMMMPNAWWKNPDYGTFVHEMAHIHQRAHPYEWSGLYEDEWKFKYVASLGNQVRGLDSIISRSRLNPDGSDFNWLWLGASDGHARWIGAVFPVVSGPVSLVNVNYVSVPLDKVGDSWLLPERYQSGDKLPLLKDDREFMDYFGLESNNYHPNELGAQMLETWSHNMGPGDKPSSGMQVFDKWLRKLPWIKELKPSK